MNSWITKSKIKCLHKAAFEADKKRKECTESCSKAIGPEDWVVVAWFLSWFGVFFLSVWFFFLVGDSLSSSSFWRDKPSLWPAYFRQQAICFSN